MKKLSSIILAMALGVSTALVGCSSGGQKQQTSAPAPAASQDKKDGKQEKSKTDFPKKPVQLTIGFAAGGGTDVVARAVVNAVNKYLPNGQSVVVENKPGASGTIQLAEIMKGKPDGYTIGSVTTGNLAIQPNYGKTPYKAEDFQPIARFNSAQNLLVVKSDAPWKTFDEWLDYVKKNPGKFKYSTAGAGNTQHLAMEALNQHFGTETKHVPFDGAAPAMTALLGGHVDGAVVLTQEAKPNTDSGAFRVLANMGTTKSELYKDAVFLKDKGFVGLDTWSGVVVPKGTPKEIVDVLSDAFKKAMDDAELKDQLKKIGLEPGYAGPEDFAKIIEKDAKITGDVAKKIGLVK
jgi:tripartite-type tricarboxylate transporter receptor subunit TctC